MRKLKKKTVRNFLICLTLMSVCFYSAGCASVLTDDSQSIMFDSDPEGADVTVGPYEGKTPCTLQIPKGKEYMIEANYNGDKKVRPLNKEIAGVTWINVLFWPGFIVDIATGKIHKYSPEVYNFNFDTDGDS